MSRVARMPVELCEGVGVTIDSTHITVKGPLGSLSLVLNKLVTINSDDRILTFCAANDSREAGAMSGTVRALVKNMVSGVSKGFRKKLILVGVGFRAQIQGDKLNLSLGFSHPIVHQMPIGIECVMPTPTEIEIVGINKEMVGQVAAEIRAYRPPEPYKGKGVRYADEVVKLKETKKK